ncbi:acyl-CoA reductase [Prochlorococcus marinus]|uniref:acyl-CoA reductase n=1 Tax=Prochlorococcus marinus TaxID=1219 RepID=UPI0022B5A324|nr:acyl-CoA reductase [Prochlorococcus marinus]
MNIDKADIECLAGSKPENIINEKPFQIYDLKTIDFLSKLSSEILALSKKDDKYRIFLYFALWSRKSNLLRLSQNRNDLEYRFGRGFAFHIAPSNVVTNILFTMAFGLLSGCPSLIRISNKSKPNIIEIIHLINTILHNDEFLSIKKKISLISYSHNESISQSLSINSSIRVIWGGDSTINYFKRFNTQAKCIDLVFPNRTSSALISGDWLINSSEDDQKIIATSFANDIALFAQKACSSPTKLYVLDDGLKTERVAYSLKKFFMYCDQAINNIRDVDTDHSFNNFKSASLLSLEMRQDINSFRGKNIFVLYYLDNAKDLDIDFTCENSCLLAYKISDLIKIKDLLHYNNQTIVAIGFDKYQLESLKSIVAPLGTDRIVRAGMALNMDINWDGYDIVSYMTRLIQVSNGRKII